MPSRRTVLKTVVAAGALPLVGLGGCAPPTRPGRNEIFMASEYFESLGYRTIERLPLVSEELFNGGVRYDDTRPEPEPGKTLVKQLCCRVDDLDRAGEPGVLAMFTIFAVSNETPEYRGEMLDRALDFLGNEAGLDPAKLVIVTTDAFFGLEAIAARNGIEPGRVIFRGRDEAVTAGDGSGYFSPAGHPYQPARWTAGLYYPLDASGDEEPSSYPLAGYMEVGEVVISRPDELDDGSELFGFGVERLALLRGADDVSFERSAVDGLMVMQNEMEEYDLPAPQAVAMLESIPINAARD